MISPRVSIIVPVYNTIAYLRDCLDSLLNQTYMNIELVLVDDKSTDDSLKMLKDYAAKDKRIIIVEHKKNEGLFKARISGIEKATGEYLCFVDSDDTISCDWVRLLTKEITSQKADIVVGNTVNVDQNGWKHYYNNAVNFTKFKAPLYKQEIIQNFFEQSGSLYSWHTIWNKLYSMSLWKKALPYLKKQDKHLIMTEDIAFSTVLFFFAEKLVFKNIDCYFYYKRQNASTNIPSDVSKIQKNICDVALVFNFLQDFFTNTPNADKYLLPLKTLKDKYYRIWCHTILNSFPDNLSLKSSIQLLFNKDKLEDTYANDFYFYQVATEWNNNYENIKAMIANKKYNLISFDIFDTLIIRPFWSPSDLFILMSKPASEILKISNYSQFISMRKLSEDIARKKASKSKPFREDISLDEIYEQFSASFGISKELCTQVMALELDLEKKYCARRESGVELLEMAQSIGKKIVLTSDMYLTKAFVEELLSNLNIKFYNDLLISSDVGVLKTTGNLFKYLCTKHEISPSSVLHIGDNWSTDIVKAKEVGLEAVFLAKTTEIFTNSIANIYTGGCFSVFENDFSHKTSVVKNDFPYRTILALVANKFFDKPNYSFQEKSDFNGDSYFIGYYVVGFFLLGLTKWLQKEMNINNQNKIYFLARDGYLPQKAFDILGSFDKRYSNLKSEYFYASRKALMPYSIKTSLDFYSIASNINLYTHTPSTVLNLLKDVLLPFNNEIKLEYEKKGIDLNKPFVNFESFSNFINNLISISYDEKLYNEKTKVIKDYYKSIFNKSSAIFDIGYSGKLPKIICDLSEENIYTYFVHSSSGAEKIATDNKFIINKFLDFTPTVSGVILEYLLSYTGGSCTGYCQKNASVSPIISSECLCYEELYPILTLQEGAIDFVSEFSGVFSDCLEQFNYNNSEICKPLLYYLSRSKEFDTYMFNYTNLEDEIFGGKSQIPFLAIYQNYLKESNIKIDNTTENRCMEYIVTNKPPEGASKIKKAIYYFLFNKKLFRIKLKEFFNKKSYKNN